MQHEAWIGKAREAAVEHRYFLLLVTLLLIIFLDPLFHDLVFVSATLGTLMLLAAIDCLRFRKESFLASRWFGIFVLLLTWVSVLSGNFAIQASHAFLKVSFLAFVTGALIYQVAVSKEVTLPVIVGAIDGYLLLGIMGSIAFIFIEYFAPGSFQGPFGEVEKKHFLYYSFVTLTTLGYGDISPVSDTARSTAVILSTAGQLYLAVLIALLVGKFASRH